MLDANISFWINFQSRSLTWPESRQQWQVIHLVVRQCTNVTHKLVLTVNPFQTLLHVTMNVRNQGVGVYNTMVDIRNNHMGGYCKLSLQAGNEKYSTHG